MSLYQCQSCGCVENTALGLYWSRSEPIWPEAIQGKALCSECAPATFNHGSPSGYGVWHQRFPKRSADGMLMDSSGFIHSTGSIDAGQLPKHLHIIGEVHGFTIRPRTSPVGS